LSEVVEACLDAGHSFVGGRFAGKRCACKVAMSQEVFDNMGCDRFFSTSFDFGGS